MADVAAASKPAQMKHKYAHGLLCPPTISVYWVCLLEEYREGKKREQEKREEKKL